MKTPKDFTFTITPQMIYGEWLDKALAVAEGEVGLSGRIEFRPPRPGDRYISSSDITAVLRTHEGWYRLKPRFVIIKPRRWILEESGVPTDITGVIGSKGELLRAVQIQNNLEVWRSTADSDAVYLTIVKEG
jgi:hypothetical protein